MDERVPRYESKLFSELVERNKLIAEHSKRVSLLSVIIGRAMNLTCEDLNDLELGGLLHDIGKMGISQSVLNMPGRLTQDEFEQVKKHPMLGRNFVEAIEYPKNIVDAVAYHHERLNGSGYPFGLTGNEIPLVSRIIAVADVFEAMTADRPYRKALLVRKAFKELSQPKQYDQKVVQALISALSVSEMPEFEPLAVQLSEVMDAQRKEAVLV